MISIRTVQDGDYESLAELHNAIFPHDLYTADELLFMDKRHHAPCLFSRFVALLGSQVVGASSYVQHAGMYHPQKFNLDVWVHETYRQQGIGRRLYEQLLAAIKPFQPISIRAQIQEHHVGMIDKLASMGFRETKRDWESSLQLEMFDSGLLERLSLAPAHISFSTMAELGDSEEQRRRYFDFYSEVRRDVPRSEPATEVSYDSFKHQVFEAPDYIPEGLFLALDEGDYVGMSQLFKGASSLDLYTGLTAVKRDYRGQKIAWTLKLMAIDYALGIGSPAIHTDNDSNNHEMLAINEKLGFEKHPAWLSLLKTFDDAVVTEAG